MEATGFLSLAETVDMYAGKENGLIEYLNGKVVYYGSQEATEDLFNKFEDCNGAECGYDNEYDEFFFSVDAGCI